MKCKSIILLSSGLDSCFALVEAIKSTKVVSALTFDYGQAAKNHEIALARKIAKHYHLSHRVIRLPYFKDVNKKVWVPNRNGVFLNIAAAIAETENIKRIYVGFNREEAFNFPDNSYTFIDSINKCFKYSTLNSVQVVAPASRLDKAQILKKLIKNGFPLNLIWSCYKGGPRMCGKCESCIRLKRAIQITTCDRRLFNF